MSRSIAERALQTIGEPVDLRELAAGMSSAAWVGSVDGVEYVVRVPVGDGRRPPPRYADESRLLADLAARGAPVANTAVAVVDGHECAIAQRMPGHPLRPDDWTAQVVDQVARFLTILHATAPGLAVEPDVIRRFHLATIWPFDGSDLVAHPVADTWPDRLAAIDARRRDVDDAARSGPITVVHTDLHPQHLLIGEDGVLAGVLDFGDSFAGWSGWDHACLRYYHGADVQRRVAEAMGADVPSPDAVDAVGVAWALYKFAKTPDRADVRERVDAMLLIAGC